MVSSAALSCYRNRDRGFRVTSGGAFLHYNVAVVDTGPGARRDPHSADHPKPHIYDLEATGLIVIAVLILILTLVRYWHNIPWGAR